MIGIFTIILLIILLIIIYGNSINVNKMIKEPKKIIDNIEYNLIYSIRNLPKYIKNIYHELYTKLGINNIK